jgi:hypothetical protein
VLFDSYSISDEANVSSLYVMSDHQRLIICIACQGLHARETPLWARRHPPSAIVIGFRVGRNRCHNHLLFCSVQPDCENLLECISAGVRSAGGERTLARLPNVFAVLGRQLQSGSGCAAMTAFAAALADLKYHMAPQQTTPGCWLSCNCDTAGNV